MKPALCLCLKNPLTRRDEARMGIEALARHFDVRILDCTAWLMPSATRSRTRQPIVRPELREVRSLAQFKSALAGAEGGYAIDYVGQFSPAAILMFEALRARGIKLVVIDSGAFPAPEATFGRRTAVQKLIDALHHGGIRQHLNARLNRLLLAFLPEQRADFALVSGSSWRRDPRFAGARRHIEAHSFDYERYREVCAQPPEGSSAYAVYLDEDIAQHEDNLEMGVQAPASASCFYPALAALFDRFESATGLPVRVAGYPNGRPSEERFGRREVQVGRSAELIRSARLVFAHASTAISFAVLWRKPLAFLTSEEIERSWYQPWIDAPRVLLGSPLLRLEDADVKDLPAGVDEAAYARYQAAYIKSAESPERSLWDIFRQVADAPIMGRA